MRDTLSVPPARAGAVAHADGGTARPEAVPACSSESPWRCPVCPQQQPGQGGAGGPEDGSCLPQQSPGSVELATRERGAEGSPHPILVLPDARHAT